MAVEETDPVKARVKKQIAEDYIARQRAAAAFAAAYGGFEFGAGGLVGVGVLDPGESMFGAYGFPTFGGGSDGAFGPNNIFGINPPPNKPKAPAKGKLDWGGWKKPGSNAPGPFQPGSKFEGGSNAPPPSVVVRPLARDGRLDFRFEAKQHNREPNFPDFAGGTRTVTLETTDEKKQQFVSFHADPRLVAANRGPSPSYGTPVADVTEHGDLSGTRHAPLQSALRVVKSPRRSVMPGQTPDQRVADIPNSLSLNINTTGLGETIGVMVTENCYGRNRHARLTRCDGGTFAVGPKGCKHRLGSDGDNDPILPLHFPCEGLFSWDDNNPTLDGPLAFNPIPIGEYAARSGYTYRVDSCWDPGWVYVSGSASYRGAWTYRVQVPISVTTPSEPKDPPPPPPPPPPTTGGDPPPGPVTGGGGGPTTGGPPPQGPTTPGGDTRQTSAGGGGGGGGPPADSAGRRILTPPSLVRRNGARMTNPSDHAVVTAALGLTAMVFRPRMLREGARDLAYGLDGTMKELAAYERDTPAVLRFEVYGKQGGAAGGDVFGASSVVGPDFIRTQDRDRSRARGGTAPGGGWFMPPETGLEDVDGDMPSDSTRPTSAAWIGFGPGVSLGFGLPDVPSGGMRDGFGVSLSSGSLLVRSHSAVAVATTVVTQSPTMLVGHVGFALAGALSPSTITGDVDDYAPTGLSSASFVRLLSNASHNITGLVAAAQDGRVLTIHNIGANDIVLTDEDLASAAANRFALPDGDLTVTPDMMVLLQYDFLSLRWRVVSGGGGGGTASEWDYVAKSVDYGAAAGEFVDVDATAANRTITLPTAVGFAGSKVGVRKSDGTANTVTVDTTGGQTINGSATHVITSQYENYSYVSDGANWMIT